MGTRNIIMVFSNKQIKVAQYSQWDNYPSGQGLTALKFLHDADLNAFKEKVDNLHFVTDAEFEDYKNSAKEIDKISDYATREMTFNKIHPSMSRDTGADILNGILYGEISINDFKKCDDVKVKVNIDYLHDSTNFAADSLFCEWGWVIDLDKRTFEAYKGFVKRPLGKQQRFRFLQDANVHYVERRGKEQYYPIKRKKVFSLDALPTEDEFLESFMTKKDIAKYRKEKAEKAAKAQI